jgi:hypothetical protein
MELNFSFYNRSIMGFNEKLDIAANYLDDKIDRKFSTKTEYPSKYAHFGNFNLFLCVQNLDITNFKKLQ